MVFPQRAFSCETPVYQYALANWQPDSYRLYVVYPGREGVGLLQEVSSFRERLMQEGMQTNLLLIPVDANQALDGIPAEVANAVKPGAPAFSMLLPPRLPGRSGVIWRGEASAEIWQTLVESDVRTTLINSIVNDLSAGVFLYIEQKPGKKSDKAFKSLQKHLTVMEKTLRPSVDSDTAKVHFPAIKVNLDPLNDPIFLKELKNATGINAFPAGNFVSIIYGRGRVMELLETKYFSKKRIKAVCEYLLGECACEIKAQNPGFDILLRADWNSAELPLSYQEFILPELVSIDFSDEEKSGDIQPDNANIPETQSALYKSKPLWLIFPIILIILFLMIISIVFKGKNKRK